MLGGHFVRMTVSSRMVARFEKGERINFTPKANSIEAIYREAWQSSASAYFSQDRKYALIYRPKESLLAVETVANRLKLQTIKLDPKKDIKSVAISNADGKVLSVAVGGTDYPIHVFKISTTPR